MKFLSGKYIYKFLVSVCISAMCFSGFKAMAVPAKPGVIKFEQPGGGSVDVIIYGDENGHFITTADGYVLSELNERLYFAECDSMNGTLRPSRIQASNPSDRDAVTNSYLHKIDKAQLLRSSFQRISELNEVYSPLRKVNGKDTGSFGLLPDSAFPLRGEQRGVVILVEFSDVGFNEGYDPYDYFSRMLNEDGFSDWEGTGSAREYFIENSRGKFQPYFDVYGPVILGKPMAYYGGNDKNGNDMNPAAMIVEACMKLDDKIDFSEYDRDGDGNIDNVFVFYAGRGEASGGLPSSIWPHSWDIRAASETPIRLDGKILGKYACTNEWQKKEPDGIGTFVHEFSHVLGLPDLYATSYTKAFTPGNWSVMDQGSYNNDSRTPPMYSGFERYALGWSEAPELAGNRTIAMKSISDDDGYVLSTSDDNEKYFIEYRDKTGWDKYIPGTGMLLWHVNYSNKVWNQNVVNDDPAKQYVDLIEAGGKKDSDSRAYHSFPGAGGIRKVTVDTHPDLEAWNDNSFFLSISNIEERDGTLNAKVSTSGSVISAPTNLTVSDISVSGLTANWTAVSNASDYIVSVYEQKEGGSNSISNGFDDGLKNLKGWSTNSMMLSYSDSNVGESAPSLTFLQTGGYVDSPMINEPITAFSFWCKAFSEGTPVLLPEVTIYIKRGVDSVWEEYAAHGPKLNANGKRITFDNLPDGVKAVRLRVTGINGVLYYIDDCEIEYGTKTVYSLIPGYPLHVGNVTSYRIDDLPNGLSGAFTVTATDGENSSYESAKKSFKLPDNDSGVGVVSDGGDSEVEYYTLEGLKVSRPVKGIYICRRGSQISKVLF